MSLETTLAQALLEIAQEAPSDAHLLTRVEARSRRRATQRRVALVTGAAVAVAAVGVVAATTRFGIPRAEPRFADPTGFLVDSRDLELRFPLTPAFLPAGLDSSPPLLTETGHFGTAEWIFGGTGGVQLRVSHSERPMITGAVPTVVDGKPAQRSCSSGSCLLTWERRPGQYVMVTVTQPGRDPRALVARVAEAGLRDEPIVHRPRLVLGLTPAHGCGLNDPRPNATSMNPYYDSGEDQDAGPSCPVSAELLAVDEAAQLGYRDAMGPAVHLGGYDGWLSEKTTYLGAGAGARLGLSFSSARATRIATWVAVLRLPHDRRLVVLTPSASPWNREELDRFVRAIILPGS